MTGLHYHGGAKRHWPLVVSLAVHALLAGAWLHSASRPPAGEQARREFTVRLLVTPPALRAPAPLPSPERDGRGKPAIAAAVSARAAPAEVPVRAEPAPITSQAPVAPSAGDILAAARRDVGKIDRDLRGKSGGTMKMQDGNRFERAIAGAHVDGSRTGSLEEYVGPDGEVLYRKRVGDRVSCRQSGSVGAPAPWRSENDIRAGAGSAKTLGMSGEAGETLCSDIARDWKRK
ncbi:hypothetical protein NX773_15530 [Massilia solisilvae]|uniref:Uncharacterized protein n=1 Tax=Massilia solisilvae TaxID=1811225 RepID=A0ABT2BM42_9BURK|nr:hypothetical protein [Massilia solisilvae]MCS0609578.1 hypothetical protein [Massilia solisilvae]